MCIEISMFDLELAIFQNLYLAIFPSKLVPLGKIVEIIMPSTIFQKQITKI